MNDKIKYLVSLAGVIRELELLADLCDADQGKFSVFSDHMRDCSLALSDIYNDVLEPLCFGGDGT